MRGTRGGLLAIVVGLAALALLVGDGGAAASPRTLFLDPIANISAPTYITAPPGDATRLFVVQQTGQIELIKGGVVSTFMTVPDVLFDGNERGLFSMAFPPDYPTSGRFYVYYTRDSSPSGAIQVDEFQRLDADHGDPSTRRGVITVLHPSQANHNGGQLQFGPDGMLYMGTGDGGGGGDPFRSAMNLMDLRGKILRIDPRQSGADPYTVPANNPFAGWTSPARPEIWSYGVRNPWRFTFDRVTGDFNLADVGQNQYEEIDYRPVSLGWGRGTNFGWSCFEGRHVYRTSDPYCNPPRSSIVPPILEYSHAGRSACSITGGYVVRDQEVQSLLGRYLYTDLCNGNIYSNVPAIPDAQGDAQTGLILNTPTTFGEDACGHVYVAGQGQTQGNTVFHIRQTDPPGQFCIPQFDLPVLTAQVEDDFTISLKDTNGQELDGGTLPQGAYKLELDDNSTFHNFHLTGGSVSCVPQQSCASDVESSGHETWTVNFTPGSVTFLCDPHRDFMYGTFTVTGGAGHPTVGGVRGSRSRLRDQSRQPGARRPRDVRGTLVLGRR